MLASPALRVILCILFALQPQAQKTADPLETAKALANSTYAGFTYGTPEKITDKVTDCTAFVLAVVLELAKAQDKVLSDTDRRLVTIGGVSLADAQILVAKEDTSKSNPSSRIRGVQCALVTLKLGIEIEPAAAKAGDFVQYWYQETQEGTTKSEWHGHAGIIEKVDKGKATIYGCHKSALQSERATALKDRKGGIGSGPTLDLKGQTNKLFVARWTYVNPAKAVAK
jgi:hypothetical protein